MTRLIENLITPRTFLREMQEDDWRHIRTLEREVDATQSEQRTEEYWRGFVRRIIAQQEEHPRNNYRFAIISKDEERLIGWCDLYISSENPDEAEVGFRVGARHWNRGYATEAASIMLAFAFGKLGIRRVWGECETDNFAAARVMEKIGMRRSVKVADQSKREKVVYEIEAGDWRAANLGG